MKLKCASIAIALLGLLTTLAVQANYSLANNMIILNADAKSGMSLFLIHNISHTKIFLDHPEPQYRYSHPMGWGSAIAPKHWSGFLLNQEPFKISCQNLTGPKKNQYINCNNYL
jgi:hypothetical protein